MKFRKKKTHTQKNVQKKNNNKATGGFVDPSSLSFPSFYSWTYSFRSTPFCFILWTPKKKQFYFVGLPVDIFLLFPVQSVAVTEPIDEIFRRKKRIEEEIEMIKKKQKKTR